MQSNYFRVNDEATTIEVVVLAPQERYVKVSAYSPTLLGQLIVTSTQGIESHTLRLEFVEKLGQSLHLHPIVSDQLFSASYDIVGRPNSKGNCRV